MLVSVRGSSRQEGLFGGRLVHQSLHRDAQLHQTLLLQDVVRETQFVLWDTDLSAGVQEVLHISPTLCHAEFGHCRRGDVDAADRARANVIGQMAEHDTVHQRRSKVFRKDDFQSALDAVSQLLHQLQLLSQLLHLSPHGELRIDRLQALVAAQEHAAVHASVVMATRRISMEGRGL